ncbi:hypothetical protein [Heyndrickxia acidicola]|uniref:Uncharacterized protein n=1 Tax=Heyndrickxia acidicola TaxID=209389 RepID=A0ABU6MES9_9BACI|nr:hypothetical protein [Heyndrickxia acidicola]MED1202551.1 hypothetical protein [Heyndrickxia acidicola]
MRETGDRRQTSNLIEILPYETVVTPECHTEESPSINPNKQTVNSNGALQRAVHAPLYEALMPYFNDDELYRTIGILYRAKASVDRSIAVEEYAAEYIAAFKSVVYSYKRGNVRSLFGCLFNAWRVVTTEIKRRTAIRNSPLFYDWLAC